MSESYKLVYFVPHSHVQATKDAVFSAGGGVYGGGKYIKCSFEIPGYGQFIPVASAGANPHTGSVDKLERTEEVRVEIRCEGKEVVRKAVQDLKRYFVVLEKI